VAPWYYFFSGMLLVRYCVWTFLTTSLNHLWGHGLCGLHDICCISVEPWELSLVVVVPFQRGNDKSFEVLSFDFQLFWVASLVRRKHLYSGNWYVKNLCLMSWHKTLIYGQLTMRTEPFKSFAQPFEWTSAILPSKGSHYKK
jgi:hypothetical protein